MPVDVSPVTDEFSMRAGSLDFSSPEFTTLARPGGGFLSVMRSEDPDGVRFRLYDTLGNEIRSVTVTAEYSTNASVTMLDDGSFVIAWRSPYYAPNDRYIAQIFDRDGNAQSGKFDLAFGVPLLSVASIGAGFATLSAAPDGTISFRPYDDLGIPAGPSVTLREAEAATSRIELLTLADGTLLAGWRESADNLRVVHIGANGTALSDSFLIPHAGALAALANGTFLVAWSENVPSYYDAAVLAQMYTADGQTVGGQIHVNTSTAQGNALAVSAMGDGFAVSWVGPDQLNTGIYARFYGSDGIATSDQFQVNNLPQNYENERQVDPEIAYNPDGGLLISWETQFFLQDYIGQFGRIYADVRSFQGTPNNDHLVGRDYRDELYGLDGDDVLHGRASNDYLNGGGGNDVLYGDTGIDWMQGGSGNDYFFVENAADRVLEDAGAGHDTAFTTVSFTLEAGAEVEELRLQEIKDTLGLDLTGNEFGQVLAGNAGGNVLRGVGGDDLLQGNGGNDYLEGGTGSDVLIGGTGDDWYVLVGAEDRIIENGGEGFDTVFAAASLSLQDGQSIERLRAWDEASTASLDLSGNELGQTISGNEGSNRLFGGGGDDVLEGRGGVDTLDGGIGADIMTGGQGNDYYFLDSTSDQVIEASGQGYDVVFTTATFDIRSASVEELQVADRAGTVSVNLYGNDFAQILVGNDGENSMDAGAGNDTLWGLGGSDRLDGGGGDDTLIGGSGVDVFAFSQTGYRDRIVDFASGTDRIDLRQIDAVSGDIFADNAFTWIGSNAFTGIAGQLRTYSEGGVTYLAGDVNGDAGVDFLIDLGSSQVQVSDIFL